MRVLVAGGTGAIGLPLLELLTANGHEAWALSRHADARPGINEAGGRPLNCDALDVDALRSAVLTAQPEVIVNQLTALPDRFNPRRVGRELAATNTLRRAGSRNLMAVAGETGVRHVVSQSIAFAYAPDAARLAREDERLYTDAPGEFSQAVAALSDLERVTLGTDGVLGTVLRYGWFYGPGTHYAAASSIASDVRRRRFPIVGSGGGVFSFIHVRDAASATLAALERSAGGIYNVVDDDPAPVSEWLPVYAELLGARPPMRIPTWLGRLLAGPYGVYITTEVRGASNAKAREELGWTPAFPSWRDGWRAELSAT